MHDNQIFQCNECGKGFSRESKLKYHKKYIHECPEKYAEKKQRKTNCPICNKEYEQNIKFWIDRNGTHLKIVISF